MRRYVIAAVALAAFLGLVVMAAVGGLAGVNGAASATQCAPATNVSATPTTAAGLNADQLHNAGLIISFAQSTPGIGAPGAVVALAASMTEAGLTNLPGGDADSAGLFQMRPSQGWGTYQQVTDPNYSIPKFYAVLQGVAGWQQMPPGSAAQAVEKSAFPDRYNANVPLAQNLVNNALPGQATNVALVNNCPVAGSVPLGPGGASLPPEVQQAIAAAPAQVQQAINFALAQVGKPYVWGGTGPDGYDCSGLSQAAYASAGISLPRVTFNQVNVGTAVPDQASLLPGDLVFPEPSMGHVQMYLGGGLVVEAQHTGVPILVGPIWGFAAARRVV